MANYNTDRSMLTASIESILKQSYRDFELIIVDDASTDESKELVYFYAKKDPRIKVIENEINSGLACSMNKAIDYSCGEYIARMDTDDIALPNRFKIQAEFLDNNFDIDICGSFAKVFGAQHHLSLTPFYRKEYCKVQLLYSSCLIHPTVMMRKKFLTDNHLFYNQKFLCSQDFELWARAAECGNIEMINKVLLYYRVHNGQVSIRKKLLQKEYAIEICRRQIERLASEITEEQMKLHLILCGHNELTLSNIQKVIQWIDTLLSYNRKTQIYDQDILKKMLYNRLLNLMLKSSIPIQQKVKTIITDRSFWSITNLYSVAYRAMYSMHHIDIIRKEPL